MCAIDALGMSAMLGRPVTITSTDRIITVHVNHDTAHWIHDTAIVFAAPPATPAARRRIAPVATSTSSPAHRQPTTGLRPILP
jgi:alkylmercury lyase-like protein